MTSCRSFRHSNKIYFQVVWSEARLQLWRFRGHCKFHLNFNSYKHQIEWIFMQDLQQIQGIGWELLEHLLEVTSQLYSAQIPICGRGPFRTRLQQGIKNWGFDLIKIFSPKHEDFVLAKKNLGDRCTLMKTLGVAALYVNFFFSSFSFDRIQLFSGITKTVLLVTDICTKLNGPIDTWNSFMWPT